MPPIWDWITGGSSKRKHEADMQSASQSHEREMQAQRDRMAKAERQAEQRRLDSQNAHKESMQRLRDAETKRQDELAERAKQNRADEELKRIAKKGAEERALQAMKDADAEKARQAKAREDQRRIAHEEMKKKLAAQRKREEEAHRKKMREMVIKAKQDEVKDKKEQRDNAVKQMRESVKVVDEQVTKDSDELKGLEQEHGEAEEQINNLNNKITTFKKDNDVKYKNCKDQMLKALKIFERDDKEIWAAIEKTGQREDGVGRFLKLTHALIGETMASQDQTNKLDAELHTFQILISRECQDKLTIDYLFKEERLDRFIPILEQQKYLECKELICEDEDEFNEDILGLVTEEINKQIKEWKKNHPDEIDAFEAWLDNYKLAKYKQALVDQDVDSFETVADKDMLDDEVVEEVIKEGGMKKLAAKKFKKAVQEAQNGKYKPPQPQENDDNKEEKKEEDDGNMDDAGKPAEVSKREARLLRTICLKPEGWQTFEKEKSVLTKLALVQMGPVFGGFFMRMNDVVKQAQKLLSYSNKLNDQQNQAMTALMQNVKSPKAIEASKDKDNEDSKAPDENEENDEQEMKKTADDDLENLPDYAQRKGWKVASECQVYSDTKGKWYNGEVVKVDVKNEREIEVKYDVGGYERTKQVDRYGVEVRDPLMVECRAITAAIDVDVNVTELMMSEFKVSETTLRVLPIAQGVEQSTKAILQCQSQIRQSVRLAGAILKLKPANLTDTAKPLWDAVDKGIIHIIEGALEMSKISAQYFGFFLRFTQSFQRFISMYQQDENVTLFTSLEHIKQDIWEFSAFKKEFNAKVKRLSNEAMQVIQNCVTTHIGVEQFESTRAAREKAEKDYLDAKAKYDVESIRLDNELEAWKDKKAKELGRDEGLKARIAQLKQRKKDNETFKQKWLKEIDDLLKLSFDTGDALDHLVKAEANRTNAIANKTNAETAKMSSE